tara:strand:+ start:988 stop:1623 length:636 start_codon:yes stop_codon:yes gene_type:complete
MKQVCSFTKKYLLWIFILPLPVSASTPSNVHIESIVHGGSGCSDNKLQYRLNSDGSFLKVIFSGFKARTGPNISIRDKRKFCQLTINLKYPKNWTYTLAEVDTESFAWLDEGVSGEQSLSYYFSNEVFDSDFNKKISGPYSGPIQTRIRPLSEARFAPCSDNKPLNIKTAIKLKRDTELFPNAQGVIAAGNTDGYLTQKFGLIWKKCDQTD